MYWQHVHSCLARFSNLRHFSKVVNVITFYLKLVFIPLPRNLFTLKLTYTLFTIVFWQMIKLIPQLRNLKQKFVERICDQRITREVETIQWFSPTLFARDSLVLHTLHDFLKKERLSAVRNVRFSPNFYLQIYCKVCPLLGSNGWYSISLLLHHAVSGFVWKFQLAAVYSFHSLGSILLQKKRKPKGKLEYDITLTKWCTIRWPL